MGTRRANGVDVDEDDDIEEVGGVWLVGQVGHEIANPAKDAVRCKSDRYATFRNCRRKASCC